jgi:uncharacterized protein YneF (UPF0154 family)
MTIINIATAIVLGYFVVLGIYISVKDIKNDL